MAIPVKETPILKGKEARRFEEELKANEKRQVSEAEYRKALEDYRLVKVG